MFHYFRKNSFARHTIFFAPHRIPIRTPHILIRGAILKLSFAYIKLAASRTYDKTIKKVAGDAMEIILNDFFAHDELSRKPRVGKYPKGIRDVSCKKLVRPCKNLAECHNPR